jgi:hypothetical protein
LVVLAHQELPKNSEKTEPIAAFCSRHYGEVVNACSVVAVGAIIVKAREIQSMM